MRISAKSETSQALRLFVYQLLYVKRTHAKELDTEIHNKDDKKFFFINLEIKRAVKDDISMEVKSLSHPVEAFHLNSYMRGEKHE